jgi:hypothetical protein
MLSVSANFAFKSLAFEIKVVHEAGADEHEDKEEKCKETSSPLSRSST